MKKFSRNLWRVLIMLLSLPFLKAYYDIFTAPTTGLFVVAGMDDTALAALTFVPWGFPLIMAIVIIVDMTKPDDDNRSGGITIPRVR